MKCGTCKKDMKDCTCAKDGAGAKGDLGKARWELLPWAEVEEIVEILTIGSEKYADDNWKKVPRGKRRYIGALMRHVVAWIKGEKKDPETGKSHLAHAGCCLLFLLWFDKQKD